MFIPLSMDKNHFNKKYFITIIQVSEPALRQDLLHQIKQESLCIKQVVISGGLEIKMTNSGMSKIRLETVVLLLDERDIPRLREILDEFDLLEKEITFSYEACPKKLLEKLDI